jgi:hypothetical protein
MISAASIESLGAVVKAAFVYCALVFGVGFLLGPIRVLLLEPRLGERAAELIEQPLMLIVVILAARWTVRHFAIGYPPGKSLAVGFIALGILLAFELLTVIVLRGLSPATYVTNRDPIAGAVYLLMLVLFALMPWLISRRRQG